MKSLLNWELYLKIVSSFFIFLLVYGHGYCQQKPVVKSMYFEFGKNGLVANLYYDQRIKNKNYGFRVGAGSNFGKYLREMTAVAGGYYLLGNKINFFETGVDLGYISIEENSDDQVGIILIAPDKATIGFYSTLNLGYRLVSRNFLFRIGIAPGLIKDEFVPGAVTSIGVVF